MNNLAIDVEPTQVSDDFIIEKICECMIGKTHFAFGEPASKWEALIQDAQFRDQAAIYCHSIKRQPPPCSTQEAAREAVIGWARELIDNAWAHGWTDQLEEWGVWQREI